MNNFLEKPSNIWITIGGIGAGAIIAFYGLVGRVDAQGDRLTQLELEKLRFEQKLDTLLTKVNEVTISQAETRKDIEYIKSALDNKNGRN